MISAPRLAWLQLKAQKMRLLIAVAGVAFAVILISMQLGFQDALFTSAANFHGRLNADLVLVSPQSSYLVAVRPFSRRRLYQAAGLPGVESVSAVYTQLGPWKNPTTGRTREIFIIGVNPAEEALLIPEVNARRDDIRYPDWVLFDEKARPEFGPIADLFHEGKPIETELNRRHVVVRGLFPLGTSFGVDGSVVTSDLNFLRIFPARPPGLISAGLIRLEPGVDPKAVQAEMRAQLPLDVLVLTKAEYMQREVDYWATSTPIGYVFGFGVVMGLVVGAIIVYQILFADISDHLPEYATLKAMGYPNRFLVGVVLMEALILAVAGYLPGLLLCLQLFSLTRTATRLPMEVTPVRSLVVLGLTVVMCWVSGLLAVRKVRSADPAEIF